MAEKTIGENFQEFAQQFDINKIIDNFKAVVTQKYFCFDGRTGFMEFWQYIIVILILGWIPVVGQLFLLATLLPTLGITARRLHDTGKSGWLQIIALIPVIGGLAVLFLCAQNPQTENNPFGGADK